MKLLKKLNIFDIIIGILFIAINILSILVFGYLGLISIPILLILIFIYFKYNLIIKLIKNIFKKEKHIEETNDLDDDIIIKKKNLTEVKDKDIVKKVTNKKNIKEINNKKKKLNNKKRNGKIKEKKSTKILKLLLNLFLIFCITCVLGASAFITYIVVTTEDFNPDKLSYQDQTVVYDKNGVAFAKLGTEKRESVTYDELPQVLIDAIIATEDSRFFQHNGVDFARFLKASIKQLLGSSGAGGASTLTMQVSKNNLTSTNSSGIEGIIRKFRDVYISVFQIEKKYTKEEIIEFYVNDNNLGGSNYGVEQACQYYFGKSVSDINLAEASIIAGLFQKPNTDRPDLHPDNAESRRKTVLYLMKIHGYITEEEEEYVNSIPVESLVVSQNTEEKYGGYLDTVVAEIEEKLNVNPYVESLKIYTALDTSIQDGIDNIMSGKTYAWENEIVQAGIAVVDVNNGEITAIGAGRNRTGLNTWNYATQARRQPGSTSKPIFDYGPGFEYGTFYSTYTLFNDEPWTYTNGPSVNNWDGQFVGLTTLKSALASSRNIPALKAFQMTSKANIQSFVTSLGITPESPLHEAHAIGGFTGATPLEMAAAYATFANGGYYIEPHTVLKVEFRTTGETKEFKYTKERVMEASTAFMINNILQYAVDYVSDGGARVYGKTVAAKTGTSNYDEATMEKYNLSGDAVNDLWTIAYTPQYSIGLWYGYKELNSTYYNTNTVGGSHKNDLMRQIVKIVPMTSEQFEIPDTVVQSKVEFGTWPAQLPSAYTPSELIYTEYFIKGTQPTEVSQRFEKFSDVKNVKVENLANGKSEITWEYTTPEIFTETYLKKYFSQNVFGNGTAEFVSSRLSSYGGIGFGIYKVDDNNKETLIGFTTTNKFEYTNNSSKDVNLIIKVQYKDYNANASTGVSAKITKNISDTNSLTTNIKTTEKATIGSYSENDINVTLNRKDITNEVTITYTIESEKITTNNHKELIEKINLLNEGEYVIKYKITYKDQVYEYNKKLTLIKSTINE